MALPPWTGSELNPGVVIDQAVFILAAIQAAPARATTPEALADEVERLFDRAYWAAKTARELEAYDLAQAVLVIEPGHRNAQLLRLRLLPEVNAERFKAWDRLTPPEQQRTLTAQAWCLRDYYTRRGAFVQTNRKRLVRLDSVWRSGRGLRAGLAAGAANAWATGIGKAGGGTRGWICRFLPGRVEPASGAGHGISVAQRRLRGGASRCDGTRGRPPNVFRVRASAVPARSRPLSLAQRHDPATAGGHLPGHRFGGSRSAVPIQFPRRALEGVAGIPCLVAETTGRTRSVPGRLAGLRLLAGRPGSGVG